MHRSIRFGIPAVLTLACAVASDGEVRIQAGGPTFPQPLYERWTADYQKLHADVKIDYQGIGSGGGIRALAERSVQFAGSDVALTRDDLVTLGGRDNVLMFPTCAGAVVMGYNVPGLRKELRLTGEAIANIYLGKITRWSDARLAASNPGVALPELLIVPVWRSDGSGTNDVFTAYLAACSDEFRRTVGTGKQVRWPVGTGGKGCGGQAQVVQQTEGAITYLELNYAAKNNIPYAAVENEGGRFVKATPQTVGAAGDAAARDITGLLLAGPISRQPGADVYPIASFTYIVLQKGLSNCGSGEQAQAVLDFLRWAIHDGQKDAAELGYAPLGEAVQAKVSELLESVTYKGERMQAHAEHDPTPK